MKKLHKSQILKELVKPREGQRGLLCSNKLLSRCPSLGIKSLNSESEDAALEYYANILIEAYLNKKTNEHNQSSCIEKMRDLRPGINQGTG